MYVNFSNFISNRLFQNKQGNSMLESLINTENPLTHSKYDSFIKSSSTYCGSELYTSSAAAKGCIPNHILEYLNGTYCVVASDGTMFECEGVRFSVNQIPKIDANSLEEIKAKDNTIDFNKKYFKYTSKNGKEYPLNNNGSVGPIYSELMRGETFEPEAAQYSSFWNYMMSKDPVYILESYSQEQIREYLNEAGIEHGFFTVKMNSREATQFYSTENYSTVVYSKERYDEQYKALVSGTLLKDYKPGSVFKLGGKEYVLNESHHLDIPYGIDIFDVEFPRLYDKNGNKIE